MVDNTSFSITPIPPSRIATIDIGRVGNQKHHIKALFELDITGALFRIKELKEAKHEISFNSWLIKCIGQTTAEFPQLHGMRKGKKSIYLFKDVDISIVIEREVNGEKLPLPYVIRKTNIKTIEEIYREIREAQKQEIKDEGDFVLGSSKNSLVMKIYYTLPGFIGRKIWQIIINKPLFAKSNMGSVIITSVGMIGTLRGWVIPVSIHPLCFAICSIIQKPGVVDNKIEICDYLHLTVLVDHDVIDGAPAVRALDRLTELVESGFGLDCQAGL